MTKITAHRGYSSKYPENTLLAFQKAIEYGAERIEFDVHQTLDGQLIIHHDYYLTDEKQKLIYQENLVDIQKIEIGREKIPLLSEVFKSFRNTCAYEIELKGFGENLTHQVLEYVKKHSLFPHVEFTSSSIPTLLYLKHIEPHACIGLFVPKLPSWMDVTLGQHLALADLKVGEFSVAHCKLEILTDDFIVSLHSAGIKVHAADCNTEEDLEKAFILRVDQLSTNDVELAIKIREMIQ